MPGKQIEDTASNLLIVIKSIGQTPKSVSVCYRVLMTKHAAKIEQDISYFEERAEQELKRAQLASDPRAVASHYELACRYLEMIYPESDTECAESAKLQ